MTCAPRERNADTPRLVNDVQGRYTVTRNVVVVMLDTLQFNYLGCYGNPWIRTPNIDRFSQQGVLFENAYTEGLPTIPCRRAMFTGRYTLPVKGWSELDMSQYRS